MRRISEAETRKEMIDPALERAGWNLRNHAQVGIEIPVDGYDQEPWNGVTDYCLYRANGEVIAVVEAKRTSHDPRLAQQQAEHYVDRDRKAPELPTLRFPGQRDRYLFPGCGRGAQAPGVRLSLPRMTWSGCCSCASSRNRSAALPSTTPSPTGPTSTKPSGGCAKPSTRANARRCL